MFIMGSIIKEGNILLVLLVLLLFSQINNLKAETVEGYKKNVNIECIKVFQRKFDTIFGKDFPDLDPLL